MFIDILIKRIICVFLNYDIPNLKNNYITKQI